ncbi:MAG: efflux transporter periplasmic adaptor subunit [Deltaproteobacteria bacterium HGW-Deltaproteobacteria-6]|jgi:membrane fusion protein (multidrug efflux system)|nr:MAG: efflux transporter periplasmic adaptor subunit [Deltaproteobacteria bacterium HGW-Deltaproteobacteria-6]
MTKKMIIMLVSVGVIFGGVFGYQAFQSYMMKKYMSAGGDPEVTVSTAVASMQDWQPQISATGSLRAVRGVDMAAEVAGLVQSVHIKSGEQVKAGQLLVQINADADTAQLQTLTAARDLSKTVYERNKKQFLAEAVSQASLDADAADLKVKQAQVAQQEAQLVKKTIRAPFAGRLGISVINPGQYLNAGDKIVTLQALDSIYIDFYLPQQELSRLAAGQTIVAVTDTYPNKKFNGRISAISPKVDRETRNVQIEAIVANPRHELLPGMYATVKIQAGKTGRYLTIPRTAVTFNPYGETVYIVETKGRTKDGKPSLAVRQSFITLGPARGDQVAILKGVQEGDQVVTAGQLKLRSGSPVVINNAVQPQNDARPEPKDP